MKICNLKKLTDIHFDFETIIGYLKSPIVRKIQMFLLGPEGTNIGTAGVRWAESNSLLHKTEFIYCDTPEEEVLKAKQIKNSGIFPIFMICAVYPKLNNLFFTINDCYFFMGHYYMLLDEMQLAARAIVDEIPEEWSIASHPAPKGLLSNLNNKIIEANSNAHAAKICAEGFADMCVTTEKARKLYALKTIHKFGSPVMLFTIGTTNHGIDMLNGILSSCEDSM